MTLFELAATLTLDTSDFTKQVNKATSVGQGFADTLSQKVTAKTIALGNALYKVAETGVRAMTNLAKSAVTSAAEVRAENAQFEATFGILEKTATRMFKTIGADTNILSTRLRTVGTKAFSQFTGAGLGAVDALSAMDTYTRLAADAAAYYDISLEDADTRLRSFIRGNTEAGDAIGLFTSESQRNAYAIEEYGKKWIDLTEAQKQMLMLNVAEDIYAQSGAIGQAKREGDSWTNTVANLQETWRQTLATIGEPFVDELTPFVEGLTTKLNNETFQANLANVAGKLGEIAGTSLDTVSTAVGALVGDLDSINKWEITWDETIAPSATAGANTIIDAVNYVFATNVPHIDTVDFPTWNEVQSAADTAWEGIKTGLDALISTTRFTAKVLGFSEWTEEDTANARDWWDGVIDSLESILQYVLDFKLPDPEATISAITGWWNGVKSALSGTLYFSVAPQITGSVSQAASDVGDAVTEATGSDLAGELSEQIVQNSTLNPDNPYGQALQDIVKLFSPHAVGLDYVPYNDYLARLHEGEAVLTKTEATAWRRGEGQGVTIDLNGLAEALGEVINDRPIAINIDGKAFATLMAREMSRSIGNRNIQTLMGMGG